MPTKIITKKQHPIVISTSQSFVINTLCDIFDKVTLNKQKKRNKILAIELESEIYKFILNYLERSDLIKDWDNPRFRHIYLGKARNLMINLDNNVNITNRYLKGEISAKELANMSPYKLAPDRWKKHEEEKEHEARIFSKNSAIGTTDLFKCGKCKERKCTYYELQTRSQDEPMTTFITCLNCGNKWRE